jgi:hypothetical protein
LSETALEEVVVSRKALAELAQRQGGTIKDWRELWDVEQPSRGAPRS